MSFQAALIRNPSTAGFNQGCLSIGPIRLTWLIEAGKSKIPAGQGFWAATTGSPQASIVTERTTDNRKGLAQSTLPMFAPSTSALITLCFFLALTLTPNAFRLIPDVP